MAVQAPDNKQTMLRISGSSLDTRNWLYREGRLREQDVDAELTKSLGAARGSHTPRTEVAKGRGDSASSFLGGASRGIPV